ncbi:uncharacterized protein LOC131052592 [Cryptomeria japonica]|uniref:uncharacterized protein LOC131052592 n=1 Tax=Cryptomeria japonica TaxID=3369 RepID=UPI0027DA520B|nr:uncharacterized protein LOC131052592 [Cryptomeria japonica]
MKKGTSDTRTSKASDTKEKGKRGRVESRLALVKAKDLDQPKRPRGRPPKNIDSTKEIGSSSVPKRQVHRTPKRKNKICSFPSAIQQNWEEVKFHLLEIQKEIEKIKIEMVNVQLEQATIVATLKNGIKTQQEAITKIKREMMDVQFQQIVQAEVISNIS